MRFKTNLFLLVVVAFLSFGTQVNAQGHAGCNGKHDGPHNGQGIENKIPDLTEKQKEQIDQIHLDMKKKSLPITNELREKRAHLSTLKTTEPIDQAAIDKEIEEIGKLRTDLNKLKEKSRLDIRKVLTDDQKVVFDSQSGKGHGKAGCGGQNKKGCAKKCK